MRPQVSRELTARRRLAAGLTLLEVVLALAVLAILGAAFTTVFVNNMRHTSISGQRTQAAQVLNYFGRRVAGGDMVVLPDLNDTLEWGYGDLGTAFTDISSGDGFADPERYRVAISASRNVDLLGSRVVQYDLSVCFQGSNGESCVTGTTLGSSNIPATGLTPPLPGIN
ncbi:MAG: type II secretion system protein [Trueperaceae bacterium]|nr:type II secretion system protein [Trueperaceae bacterium]